MPRHDSSYKLLFSHRDMVRDLLAGFIHEPWLDEIDLDSLEKVCGSYVTDDLRDREDDIVWRVRFKDRWLYLYILLEFQSTVDPFMSVRMLTYLGLLYQDIIKQGLLTKREKLPPVLPVVLYNGKTRWHAATEISRLIEPPPDGLRDYTPQMKYLLLDEGAIDESGPWALKNLAAALFRLEKTKNPEKLNEALTALIDWLGASEQAEIRRAFTVWIKRVLLPGHFPGVILPELGDILEIKTMLAETVIEWTKEWKLQGIQEGMQQGMQQGETALFERLLAKRFGSLPDEIRVRIKNTNTEQLEIWAERLLDATTLAAVFEER